MRHRSVTYIIKQALIVGVELEKCADERPQVDWDSEVRVLLNEVICHASEWSKTTKGISNLSELENLLQVHLHW